MTTKDGYLYVRFHHPELIAYLEKRAGEEFCTPTEYLRRIVVDDMRRSDQ